MVLKIIRSPITTKVHREGTEIIFGTRLAISEEGINRPSNQMVIILSTQN